ncbi:MAG: hypothetical protein MSC31_11765 [Solirubrobacteraceae bacterium MAG38_C4-C5]|nr:hypothetical protein [Candidatus Siliceabacter maunaloa]
MRAAVDRLPLATRRAMLEGIQSESIIVGADGNPRGGVCPIYATASPPSKRIGAPFARAWDRFAGARLARPASEPELRTLRTLLETSIGAEPESAPVVSLNAAIAAHKASQARTRARAERPVLEARSPAKRSPRSLPMRTTSPAPRRDTGERDRTAELSQRNGWAWLRPFRRYDDYERALLALDEMEARTRPEAESQRLVPSGAGRG